MSRITPICEPTESITVPSLLLWRFWKIRDDRIPSARSNPTVRLPVSNSSKLWQRQGRNCQRCQWIQVYYIVRIAVEHGAAFRKRWRSQRTNAIRCAWRSGAADGTRRESRLYDQSGFVDVARWPPKGPFATHRRHLRVRSDRRNSSTAWSGFGGYGNFGPPRPAKLPQQHHIPEEIISDIRRDRIQPPVVVEIISNFS